MSDDISVSINGQDYTKWSEIKVERALNQCASSFDISVTEKWAGVGSTPWQIKRFDNCTITIGGQLALTGYVEQYEPSYDGKSHSVRVSGRSKTCDLVDCMPEVTPGEYDGYTLDQIAKGIASKFGVDVVVNCAVGEAFPTVVIEPTETAHSIIEKLSRQRSIILTDDEQGRLVLTQAGTSGSAGSLVEGENILSASAKITGNEMFQTYVVLSQTPLSYDDQDAQNQVVGSATDSNVPRSRRYAEMSANPENTGNAQQSAKWRALHQFAISTEGTITVYGYRQTPGGDLWQINQTAYVKSPRLLLDGSLLIGKVTYLRDNEAGSRTEMLLAPPDAFTPNPDEKVDNSDANWQGAKKITGT